MLIIGRVELSGHQAPRILLSLLPQCCDYRCALVLKDHDDFHLYFVIFKVYICVLHP